MRINEKKIMKRNEYGKKLVCLSFNTLRKMEKIINAIEETAEITTDSQESPIFIPYEKFKNEGLLISETTSILDKLYNIYNLFPYLKTEEDGVQIFMPAYPCVLTLGLKLSTKDTEKLIKIYKANFNNFKNILGKVIAEKDLEKKKLPESQKEKKITVLYLNHFGDLYMEPKEKYCYPMSESEGRHKIVRYFTENKIYNYYPTRELAVALEKDEISLMKEVGKINTIIQTKLKLKDKILDGKRGSGYRINPNYKIVLKNE